MKINSSNPIFSLTSVKVLFNVVVFQVLLSLRRYFFVSLNIFLTFEEKFETSVETCEEIESRKV